MVQLIPENNLIPDDVITSNGIELLVDGVQKINREKKNISTEDGDAIVYDKLVLATGSLPLELPIPGLEKENVFMIKKDSVYLKNLLERVNDARDIVILGGGFIGVEFADEFKKSRDANVTIVELLPHCLMLAFEEEFCLEAEQALDERGINVITGVKLEEVLGDKQVTGVKLSDGREIKADLLIAAVGVKVVLL